MSNVVADNQIIVNLQGIRYVNWGKSNYSNSANEGRPYFLSITYKGNHQTFYYRTETEVISIFEKIRDGMTFNRKENK